MVGSDLRRSAIHEELPISAQGTWLDSGNSDAVDIERIERAEILQVGDVEDARRSVERDERREKRIGGDRNC